jgi:glycosyltransferase involved in cell wall biosynthesis
LNIADVSVIIPHYNAVETVEASIVSVIDQSFRVKEIIVIDDCSNEYEQLCAIVSKLNKIFPIELIRLGLNSGASEARNHGARLATGKYLAFLDSDDIWRADKVEIQYGVMERENMHLSAHSYVHDLNVGSMDSCRIPHITKVRSVRFAFGNPFFTPTVMVRKSGFIEFDPRYRRVDDYKCWLMNVKDSPGALIGLPLAGGFKSAIGASGLTSSIRVMHDSYITVLKDLYREGHVGLVFFVTARVIEQLKYPVRAIRSKLQRRSCAHNS